VAGGGKKHKLQPVVAVVFAALASTASAGQCPDAMDTARRLVLVTTPTMNSASARMQLFVRNSPGSRWASHGPAEPAVVGQAGLAWGFPFVRFRREGEEEKFEGDRRTPAGFFRIGPSFGFAASALPGHIQVKEGETVCVEDPGSPHYNKITKRAELGPDVRADEMRSTSLYRFGLFIDYPSDRASRRGSCIFIHIWSTPTKGTAGCIAAPEERVRMLQYFAQEGAVLTVLPVYALEQFSGCLPGIVN
jgi:L,D-peptidoglycan transpeptidase YkuD (ErfK/YbiS/YcfS/YnhG family)